MPKKILFQALDFTCGPTCLLMAMQKLRPDDEINPIDEFLIWREANSIFMGHSHPGCTHYGLARAAMRRGFQVELYSDKLSAIDRMFDEAALKPREKEVFRLVHKHDRTRALKEGLITYEKSLSPSLIANLCKKKKVLLALVKSFMDHEEHWIILQKIKEDRITLIDPYEKHLEHASSVKETAERATHKLSFKDFKKYAGLGRDKQYLILAIDHPPKE